MGRTLFTVVLGVALGVAVAAFLGWVGDYAFPPPPLIHLDPSLARSMADAMPLGGMLIKLLGWSLGAFAAASLTLRHDGRNLPPAWIATGVVTLLAATVVIMSNQPVWLPIAVVLGCIGAGWGAVKLAERTAG